MNDVEVVRHFAESEWWKLSIVSVGPDSDKVGCYSVYLRYQKLYGASYCELNFKGLGKDQMLDMQALTNSWSVAI